MLNSQNSNIIKDNINKINFFYIINNFIYNKVIQYNLKITFNVF